MRYIKEKLEDCGYGVIFIPETATELISSGIAPWTMDSKVNYQMYQMMLQTEKERIYIKAAEHLSNKKTVVLCDRGLLDNKAYLSDEEFAYILEKLNFTEEDILGRYNAVFHLETLAKGRGYTLSNNAARTERTEEAIRIDERLLKVWEKHPYRRVVENKEFIDEKIDLLISGITGFLKEHENKPIA